MPKMMFFTDFGIVLILVFGIYIGAKTVINLGKIFSKKDPKK